MYGPLSESADSGRLMAEAAGPYEGTGAQCWCRGRTSVRLVVIAPTRDDSENARKLFLSHTSVVLRTGWF